MNRLEGKVAVVTGGGGGIGAETGRLFCAHGAKVLLVDLDSTLLSQTAALIQDRVPGAEVELLRGDIAESSCAAEAVSVAVKRFGCLDVLVNNAAVRNTDSIERSDPTEWCRLLSVNLVAAVNFSRSALPLLRKSGKGSIVNVSSTYAIRGRKGYGAYDATKSALLALTRTLACEEAKYGVRANAVCPGGTLTPNTISRAMARGLTEKQMREERKADSLFGRWAVTEEIAYPILWLASDEASFVTGATLMVDAGASIM